MAIALDNSASGAISSGSPWTFSYTVSGASPILWVALTLDSNQTISGVTWNTSEAMTLVDSITVDSQTTGYLFMLVNPTTGTHNIGVTFSGAANLSHLTASYTGAAAVQPDAHMADTRSTNPAVVSLTTQAAGCWMIALSRDIGGDALTLNSGGVIRQSLGGAPPNVILVDSNGPLSAAPHSFSISHVGPVQITTLIASFAPLSAPALMRLPAIGIRPAAFRPGMAR